MDRQAASSAGCLSATALKCIAILCMTLDHIAWAWLETASVLGMTFHLLGRITAPVMAFLIAEGYAHTRSLPRYFLRMAVFAVLSHFPFVYFESGSLVTPRFFTGVIYPLLCGLAAIWLWDKYPRPGPRALTVILLCVLADPGDWGMFAVLMVLIFHVSRGSFRRMAVSYSILAGSCAMVYMLLQGWESIMMLGMFLALPLLFLYNGRRGGGNQPAAKAAGKWGFYLYYPLHLLILGFLRFQIFV